MDQFWKDVLFYSSAVGLIVGGSTLFIRNIVEGSSNLRSHFFRAGLGSVLGAFGLNMFAAHLWSYEIGKGFGMVATLAYVVGLILWGAAGFFSRR